uniref:Polyneuridine-aldehyde esterase n=1 Tax=Anthurium amnicola TaxID=1678845 RepID=A0A1D1XMV6_9ARAE
MESEAGEKKHFVLVHGSCHGAWCWYKLATLLSAAGHRVTAPDLAACGTDARRIDDVKTFSEYSQPLTEVMRGLPQGEKVVLVGHSFGGLSLSLAMDRFPEKVAAGVFVTAFMPDSSSNPSYVLDEYVKRTPRASWVDNKVSFDRGPDKPSTSMLFGPKFLSSRLYNFCSPEDITLAMSLIRVGCLFQEDLSGEPPFSAQTYGSVKTVYILCDEDLTIPMEFQRWMTENHAVDEVRVVEGADHMPMLSKPRELCQHLLDIARKYASCPCPSSSL